jgi:C-terminal processing protease CtpA/Prc
MRYGKGLAAVATLFLALGAGPIAAKPAETPSAEERARLEKELAEARAVQRDAAERVRELNRRLGERRIEERIKDRIQAVDRIRIGGRAMLGVTIEDADDRSAEGARIASVSPGGPAAEAGLKSGDVIVELEGKPLKADREASAFAKLRDAMREFEPGDKVKLKVKREGKTQEFTVTTEDFGARGFAFAFGDGDGPGLAELWMPGTLPTPEAGPRPLPFVYRFARTWGDLEMVSLSEKLGSYFGAKEGVLVVRAPREEGLKLEDGDVIVKVGERDATSPEQVMRILRSYEPGEKLTLEVLRNRKRITLDVAMPDRRVGAVEGLFEERLTPYVEELRRFGEPD